MFKYFELYEEKSVNLIATADSQSLIGSLRIFLQPVLSFTFFSSAYSCLRVYISIC